MHAFDIAFPALPRLLNVVRAGVHLPLPEPPPRPAPPTRSPEEIARQERQLIEQMLTQMRQSVAQLATRYDGLVAEMRQAAVELAIAVTGRLVFDKLQTGEFPIEEMVRQAIARLPAAPAVTVYLHPEDRALLQRRLGDDPLLPLAEPKLRIEADASLRRGGCRAEAGEIHVLTDLADLLAELRQQMLWSAGHAQSGSGSAAS